MNGSATIAERLAYASIPLLKIYLARGGEARAAAVAELERRGVAV
jgi:hypothetical protein